MQRRGLRLAVVVAFVAALAGAAYFFYAEHQRAVAIQGQAREFDLARDRALASLVDARTSLQAALVPGQGEDYWLPRAATSIESAAGELAKMKQGTADGSVLNDLEAAAAALEQASTVHAEATRYLAGDMRTQASRVVFTNGVESLTSAAERIESARWTAQSQRDNDIAASESLQAIVGGGLVAFALIVVGLLLPTASRAEAVADTNATSLGLDARSDATDSGRASTVTSAAEARATTSPAVTVAATSTSTTVRAVELATASDNVPEDGSMIPSRDRRKAPELRAAADLCTDFARLVDGQEMPALLERSSKLLDSTGFIVWLADEEGHELRPSLAHGYPQQTLAKLPVIPRHGDNATAAAFRHAEMQIVRTNGMSPGAIVVPILGPSGCVGVMAAEVRHGREASESARALARIVAAQLATLISTVSSQTANQAVPASDARQAAG